MIRFIDHIFDQKINIFIFVFSAIAFVFMPFLIYFEVPGEYFIFPFIFCSIAFNIALLLFWVRMFYVCYWTTRTFDINNIDFLDQGYFTLKEFSRRYNTPVRASYHILEMLVLTRRLNKLYSCQKRIYDRKEYLGQENYHIIYQVRN